jgi:ABC-type transport system substrate-binding protein
MKFYLKLRKDELKYLGTGSAAIGFGPAVLRLSASAQEKKRIVRQAHSAGSFGPLDPQLVTTGFGYQAIYPVFNGLVRAPMGTATIDPAKLEPDLCEGWDIGKDGREYTFYLRKGVK